MRTLDGATVVILNWEKYNPRKDLKATSWFRLQNSLFEDPSFFDFSHAELLAWIYLLSLASKRQKAEVRISIAHADRIGRLRERDLASAIEKLEAIGCVKLAENPRHADVTPTSHARTTTNVTNETDETNVTDVTNAATSELAPEGASPPMIASLADPLTQEFLKSIKAEVQEAWVKTYEDVEWIRHELRQAIAWCKANPARQPKSNFARFFTAWLSRGWERHRKTLPTNRVKPKNDYSWLPDPPGCDQPNGECAS